MATKKKKKAPAKKAAKKAPAKKKPAAKKPAKKAAKKAPAKKAPAKKAAKKAPAKKAPAKKAAAPEMKKKPAAAMKKPAKKAAPSSSKPASEKHLMLTTSEATDSHVVPAKKKSLDLKSLAASYKGAEGATAHPVTSEQMDEVSADGLRGDGEILHVEDDADVAPCRLVDHGEGRFSLCLDDFKMPDVPLFAERGLQGGGYTWEAVADSLLRLRRPDLADQVAWDSEAGMFVAVGNRPNLVLLAKLLQEALAKPDVLKAAVDAADPDRLE